MVGVIVRDYLPSAMLKMEIFVISLCNCGIVANYIFVKIISVSHKKKSRGTWKLFENRLSSRGTCTKLCHSHSHHSNLIVHGFECCKNLRLINNSDDIVNGIKEGHELRCKYIHKYSDKDILKTAAASCSKCQLSDRS